MLSPNLEDQLELTEYWVTSLNPTPSLHFSLTVNILYRAIQGLKRNIVEISVLQRNVNKQCRE